MFTAKKTLAAVLTCCGVIAGAWYVGQHQNKSQHLVANAAVRKDAFAEQVANKLASVTKTSGDHAKSVIFDNDAATDDALALILIGNDPAITLKAITVAGTGEAHGRPGAENMAAIANMLGKSDVPVAYGRAQPLSSAAKPFPDKIRTAMDHLLDGSNVKPHPNPQITDNAVSLIRDVVQNSHEKVTILATGPLTNIAEFVTQYPALTNKIERIVVMGGAVNVPGNVDALTPEAHNQVSEWNFYTDPVAVQRVFASTIPITLVALDATNQVPMTKKFYDAISREEQPDLQFAHVLLKGWIDRFGVNRFVTDIYMWDALAAMVLLDPAMAETQSMPLVVDITNGRVQVAATYQRDAAKIDVVTKISQPDAVLSHYLATIKSNHVFAQRKYHYNLGRVTAYLGRSNLQITSVGKPFHNTTMHA